MKSRLKNSPYVVAVISAFIMFILIAPEINEGDEMEPAIPDGAFLVVSKARYSSKRGIPDRNKVVILEKNAARNVSKDNIIARVVGLPGEKIIIKNGRCTINGKPYAGSGEDNRFIKGDLSVKLGKEQVFIMGDSADSEKDSRNPELGPVDMKKIKGAVLLVYWPLSRFGGIDR